MELAIKAVGENGKLQKIISFVVICSACLTLVLSVSYAYLTKTPAFLCKYSHDINPHYQQCEFSESMCNSKFEIKKDPTRSVYNFSYSFNLFCSKKFYVPLLSTMFFFGGILGCTILSSVPDNFGRKRIFQIMMILSLILQINLLFVLGPVHLVIIHFFAGIASFAYGMSSVIVSEYSPRSIAGIVQSVTNAIYPLSGILVGFWFFFINNWKTLFLTTTIIHIFVTYLTIKYFVESPRLLNSQKRIQECLETLGIIAEINGTTKDWEAFTKNNQRKIITNIIHFRSFDI